MPNTVYKRRLKKKQCRFLQRDFEVIRGVSEVVAISLNEKAEDGTKTAITFDAIQMAVNPLFSPAFAIDVAIVDDGILKIDFNQSIQKNLDFEKAPYTIWMFKAGRKKIFMQGQILVRKGAYFVKNNRNIN